MYSSNCVGERKDGASAARLMHGDHGTLSGWGTCNPTYAPSLPIAQPISSIETIQYGADRSSEVEMRSAEFESTDPGTDERSEAHQPPVYSRSDSASASGSEMDSMWDSRSILGMNFDDGDDGYYETDALLNCGANDVYKMATDIDVDELIADLIGEDVGNAESLNVLGDSSWLQMYDSIEMDGNESLQIVATPTFSYCLEQNSSVTRRDLPTTMIEQNDHGEGVQCGDSSVDSFASSSAARDHIKTALREKLRKRGIDVEASNSSTENRRQQATLTADDVRNRQRRQKQNREAARRLRQKRQDTISQLTKRVEVLEGIRQHYEQLVGTLCGDLSALVGKLNKRDEIHAIDDD